MKIPPSPLCLRGEGGICWDMLNQGATIYITHRLFRQFQMSCPTKTGQSPVDRHSQAEPGNEESGGGGFENPPALSLQLLGHEFREVHYFQFFRLAHDIAGVFQHGDAVRA